MIQGLRGGGGGGGVGARDSSGSGNLSEKVPLNCRPNHCGRHLGKINGHNSIYVKVWRCIQDEFYFGCQCKTGSQKLSINLSQTGLFLTGRRFKLTSSP